MTGYTRADSVNNIADGNIINASDLDGEFDAVQAAFNSSTGHVHDGTAANGAPITKIGPTQDVVASATALTPKTTATVDVGSSALKFKDFFFSGTGTLVGLTATGAITLNTTTNNQSYTTTGAGTITISSGTAGSINNMTIGGTTPLAGAFTTLSTTGKITSGGNIQVVAAGDLTWGGNYGAGIPVINGTSGTGFTFYPNGSTSGSVAVLNASGLAITGSLSTTGSVGIGTSTISYKLTLQETSGSTFNREYVLRNGDQTNFWRMSQGRNLAATTSGIPTNAAFIVTENGGGYGASAGLALGTIESAPLLAITAGVERLRVLSTGEVGVGTSVPYSKLTVYGPTGIASANTGEATGVGSIRIENGSTSMASDGGLEFKIAGDTNGYGAKIQTLNSSGAQMIFANRSASATWVERMRIDSSGNVGIGTSSPGVKLQVGDGTASTLSWVVGSSSGTGGGSYFAVKNGSTFIAALGNYSALLGGTYSASPVMYFTGGLQFSEAGAERMRIDSSGNVGIGTSSLGNGRLTVSGGRIAVIGSAASNAAELYISNTDASGGAWRVGDAIGVSAGTFVIYGGSAASVKLAIDSSGNVGIGTSSPTYKVDVAGSVNSNTSVNVNNTGTTANILFASSGQTGTTVRSNTVARIQSTAAGRDVNLQFSDNVSNAAEVGMLSGALYFATAGTERMRIDSSGNLLVGTTTASSSLTNGFNAVQTGTATYISVGHLTGSVSGSWYASFAYNGTQIGTISQSGTTAVLYNVTSDQRLKENIQDSESSSSLIDALQVRQFDWKTDNTHQRYGFIAQELVTVAPEAVHQPVNEEEMMAVDYSKLVPMLIKEIQSLRKRLADAGIA